MSNEQSLILYGVTFFITAFMLSLCQKYKKSKLIKNILFFISILTPIIILGMRYYVGTDYQNYLLMYERYKELPFSEALNTSSEILNIIISKVIYSIYDNKYLFIIVYAVLTITIAFKAILRFDSKNTFLMTFMYLCLFFPYAINIMRQALAISIILYAYSLLKTDIKKAYILCIIAACVHISALIVLPALIIYNKIKKNKLRNIILIIFYMLFVIIIYFGLFIFPSNIALFEKFLGYVNSSNNSSGFGLGVLLLNLPVLIISLFFYKNTNKLENDYSFYIVLYLISIILAYLGYLNIYLNRFSLYFSIIQILLIPKALEIFTDKMFRKFLVFIFVIIVGIQFINTYYVVGNSEIFPYNYISIEDLKIER